MNIENTKIELLQISMQTIIVLTKQDSKELCPRPLENAPKTFNSKKTLSDFNGKRLIKLSILIMLPKLSRLVAHH